MALVTSQAGHVTPITNDTLYVFKPMSGGPCDEDKQFAGKHFERPVIETAQVPESPNVTGMN